MDSRAFDEVYAKLNPTQKEAVDAIEGPVMVIAGPGTGKTQVLTMRIANIRRLTDTPPEAILALTFTESGVASMRKRLAGLMGPDAYRVTITTFHGFANDIIRNRPDEFPRIVGSANITDVDQVRIVRAILDDLPLDKLKPFGDRYFYLRAIIGAVNELKRQGANPEEFARLAKEEERAFRARPDLIHERGPHKGKMKGAYIDEEKYLIRNNELALVYAEYEKRLTENKFYDFADMIIEVANALGEGQGDDPTDTGRAGLLRTLQEEYLYILVDEHQDTNNAQNRIIERLASAPSAAEAMDGRYDEPNLFVVGDEKQAIFRFQGASLENFLYFKSRFKNVKLVTLTKNYRSTQAILDAAHSLTPDKHPLVAEAEYPDLSSVAPGAKSAKEKKSITLAALSSPQTETHFLARRVAAHIAEGTPAEDIAILYRDNRDAITLARAFEKVGIPFAIESDQDVLGDEEIKKLLVILKTVEEYGRDDALVPLLHLDFLGLPPLDVYKLLAGANRAGANRSRTSAYVLMRSEEKLAELDLEEPAKFRELARLLAGWRTVVKNKGAADAFETIVRESGFLAHILALSSSHERIEKLHALFDQIKSLTEGQRDFSLEDFFEYLRLLEEHDVLVKTAAARGIPGRVRFMTAHKSKGLEFAYVYIVNAVDGHWGDRARREYLRLPRALYALGSGAPAAPGTSPSTETTAGKEDDLDERNLFYVALTRAKREVVITYAERSESGREQLPSRFVAEIKPELIARADTSADEEDFAAHREVEFAPAPARPNPLTDKEYLNRLFREQTFSPTALNNYLACPWQYFYRNLIRIPEAPEKALAYGSAVHAALKAFFDARGRGSFSARVAKSKRETKDEKYFLLKRFEEALAHEPLGAADYDEALAKGRRSLGGWFDAYHATWTHPVQSEVPITGIKLSDDVTIGGKLDKIEHLDNGNTVNVVDYKTGRPKSRNEIEGLTKTGDGNYKRQLVFYNLLLNRDGRHVMRSGEIDFVEPNEKGDYKKELFRIAPEEVAALETQVNAVAAEILSLAFWDKRCDDPKCRYCALRNLMKN